MIRYRLVCEGGHGFESWFPSSESYDHQVARGLVTCPACGSAHVSKGMMAPSIARGDRSPATEPASDETLPAARPAAEPATPLGEPERRLRAMMRAVREHVIRTADDVGVRFPEEARRMHYGDGEARPIYGEASIDEVRALVDEGIAIAPLPALPDDRH